MSEQDPIRSSPSGDSPRPRVAAPSSSPTCRSAGRGLDACVPEGGDWLQLFRNAVEQTADIVLITDVGGRIVHVNPAFERITGWARHQAIGSSPNILKSGLHDPAFYAAMWETLLRGEIYRATIANRRKNGDLFYIEQTISPITDAGGRITHFVSVGKDATQARINEHNESKLALARAVQQRFYPAAPPCIEGFDIAGATYPAESLGGDYFDYVSMPEGRLGLVIGDVSGHGLDAALLMSETRAYLRSFASVYSDTGQVLTSVNRVLSADIDDNRFVTLMLVRLDLATRTAVYSSAGHETCCVFRRPGSRKIEMTSAGTPLGMFPGTVYDNSAAIRLAQGDVLLLTTDGLPDAEDRDGVSFGRDRVRRVVMERRGQTAREIVDALIAAQRRFSAGRRPSDDITLIVCRVL